MRSYTDESPTGVKEKKTVSGEGERPKRRKKRDNQGCPELKSKKKMPNIQFSLIRVIRKRKERGGKGCIEERKEGVQKRG